jgi:carboxyl-terminal processing protease
VQDFEILSDGSALKLTIAKWFTPKDRAIDKEGITPDVVLEEMFTASEDTAEQTDLGVQRALEELLK